MDATWTVPKNIRQIGEAHAHYAVYIEDYVATYIKQVVRLSDGGIRQGALVGRIYPEGEKTVFVIQGIVTDRELYRTREQLFSPEGREKLREQCGQFFAELDVLGEVVFDSKKDDADTLRRGILSENTGARRLLLHVDCADGTQKFYIGSQGAVEIVESYYIYYERNEAMQNYLIAYNEETRRKVEEVHDIISGQARAAMGEIRMPRMRMQRDTILISAVCALLICVSLLGIININQYQKMCKMEESFNNVLAHLGFGGGDAVPASSDGAVSGGSAGGDVIHDITPEDGLAAGDGADDLFDGIPIYVSDTAGEGVPGQNAGGNEGTGENLSEQNAGEDAVGENADGADAANAAERNEDAAAGDPSGQGAGENDAADASGEGTGGTAGTDGGENASGQSGGENGQENAPGQNAGENGQGNAPGQNAGENGQENASGQNAADQNGQAGGAGESADGTDTQQGVNGGGALAAGGIGESGSGAYREYTIQKGDTLTAISMLFYQNKSMIEQICTLNGIENADNIVAGQKILLP